MGSGSRGKDVEFVPKQFWHLDPVYRAYAKLYIADMLQLSDYPTGTGAFAYKNHPIYRVDLIGWLVRVEERNRMFQYGVDDGTGVINCCCWKPKATDDQMGISASGPTSFFEVVRSKVQEFETQRLTCLELGDVVHVRGRLKRYHNRLEVSASYYTKIEDPTCESEMNRMEELSLIYESVYDRPFVLPSRVAQNFNLQMEEMRTGSKRKTHLVDRLCDHLRGHLTDKAAGIKNFYLMELETIDTVMEIASAPCIEYRREGGDGSAPVNQFRSVIKLAVERLDSEGLVFRSGRVKDMYEVSQGSLNSRLHRTILQIVRADCQLAKYENGCHYLHVKDRLHVHSDFQNVSADTVRLALSRLEEQSEVISTTFTHFMPVS